MNNNKQIPLALALMLMGQPKQVKEHNPGLRLPQRLHQPGGDDQAALQRIKKAYPHLFHQQT